MHDGFRDLGKFCAITDRRKTTHEGTNLCLPWLPLTRHVLQNLNGRIITAICACSWLFHVGNAPSLTEVPIFNGIDLHISCRLTYLHEARAESDSHSNGWACLKTPLYHELLTRFSIALTPSKQSRGPVSMIINNLAG